MTWSYDIIAIFLYSHHYLHKGRNEWSSKMVQISLRIWMATISSLLLLGIDMVLPILSRMVVCHTLRRSLTERIKVVKNFLFVHESSFYVYGSRWTYRWTEKRANWIWVLVYRWFIVMKDGITSSCQLDGARVNFNGPETMCQMARE